MGMREPGAGTRSAARAGGRTVVWFPRRADHTSGLGVAASTDDDIDGRFFWTAATAVVIGYMVSRGIAKAATRSRAHDPREDIEIGSDN